MMHAYIPLAKLFGYTSDLRNVTSGTARFTHGAEPLRPGEGGAGGHPASELMHCRLRLSENMKRLVNLVSRGVFV